MEKPFVPAGFQRRTDAEIERLGVRLALIDLLNGMIAVGTVVQTALVEAERIDNAESWGDLVTRVIS